MHCFFGSDRFRTTVNVLGDSFGVAIVQHYSQKQLAKDSPPAGSSTTSTPSHIGEPNCTININCILEERLHLLSNRLKLF